MNQALLLFFGMLLPFFGTTLGSGAVFFLPKGAGDALKKALFGFSAGVMAAASVWSLLIPSIEMAEGVFPAVIGFLCGILCFLTGDLFLNYKEKKAGEKSRLVEAVTLHNLPEGMAVGMVLAEEIQKESLPPLPASFLLALGIALQNLPEGAVISLPAKARGKSKATAFLHGALSGIVEPLGAGLALCFTALISPTLPYLLSFAAGSMIYVVCAELIPSFREKGKELGVLLFAVGFTGMMALDVALG